MFRKGSKVYSILGVKCPRCHQSDMFPTGPFSFNQPFDMKERCDKCDADFFPEPGYYYGAMFISYIFTGFFSIGFVLFVHWVLGWGTMASFAALIAILGIFFVYIFRVARAVFINLHVHYDPDAIAKYGGQSGGKASTASHYGR